MSQSSRTSAPVTRQKASTITRSQRDLEEAEGQNMDVWMKEQAINFLIAKNFIIPGNPLDIQTLAYVLLQIGSMMTRRQKQITDLIRVVALLLANASTQRIAEEITKMVKSQLQVHIEKFTAGVEDI
jgi:hypothetical protein